MIRSLKTLRSVFSFAAVVCLILTATSIVGAESPTDKSKKVKKTQPSVAKVEWNKLCAVGYLGKSVSD